MPSTPDALLFITPGCPHCPGVLQGLSEMVKQGTIGKLTVINAASHPELRPQNPSASFLLGQRSEAYVVREHFTQLRASQVSFPLFQVKPC